MVMSWVMKCLFFPAPVEVTIVGFGDGQTAAFIARHREDMEICAAETWTVVKSWQKVVLIKSTIKYQTKLYKPTRI